MKHLLVTLALTLTPHAHAADEPFAFADFTWLNGNSRQTEFPLATKYFTGQFTFDGNYVYQFAQPRDHTLVGSTNAGRTGEFQVQQLGIGGDFSYQRVRGRVMTQFGMYSTMTPRNDASPSRGQWNLGDAYRYLSEAYAGYHWDTWHGINLDAGIFMSYVGLCSYYNYENWIYQMSYVSANTPWYFNGVRLQMFPTDRLKAEVWLVNGWQSYGTFNEAPGLGAQILWRPSGRWSFVTNEYVGADWLGKPGRARLHSDTSAQVKYFDRPAARVSKAAASLTADFGCENGDGVRCGNQNFLGFMAYNRLWFARNHWALTVGGGAISNPGRYLVLVPPVDGADAAQGAAPDFTANVGDRFRAWDTSLSVDYMPEQAITYRLEYIHRAADVPYFAGPGGVTKPADGGTDWRADLVKAEDRVNFALLVRL